MFSQQHARLRHEPRRHLDRPLVRERDEGDAVFRQYPAHGIEVFAAQIHVDRLRGGLVDRHPDDSHRNDGDEHAGTERNFLARLHRIEGIDNREQPFGKVHGRVLLRNETGPSTLSESCNAQTPGHGHGTSCSFAIILEISTAQTQMRAPRHPHKICLFAAYYWKSAKMFCELALAMESA